MNHGGLGYIEGYELFLPDDVLRPLSIIHRTELFGIYYPKARESDPAYIEHDLMITPISYNLWPKIGHYVIRLHHRPQAILEISQVLVESQVSILLAEVTRDSHRYDTWNLTVSFDDLPPGADLTYNAGESYYTETSEAVAKTKRILLESCQAALFRDDRNADLRESVVAIEQTALSYFYWHSLSEKKTEEDRYLSQHFVLRYDADRASLTDYGNKQFKNVMDHIWGDADLVDRRAIVPVSVDSGDLNVRAMIVLPNQHGRFFEGRLEYNKTGKPGTRGLMANFLSKMGRQQNIWRLFNHTRLHREGREEGSIMIVFEDLKDKSSDQQRLNFARQSFDRMKDDPLPDDLVGVDTIRAEVFPLTPARARARLGIERERRQVYRYDVFISYASEDSAEVDKLEAILKEASIRPYRYVNQVKPGRKYREEILRDLRSSMCFCLVCSEKSIQKEWLYLEWGAAWGLRMPIVPILIGDLTADVLPQDLSEYDCVFLNNEASIATFVEVLADGADSVKSGFFDVLGPRYDTDE